MGVISHSLVAAGTFLGLGTTYTIVSGYLEHSMATLHCNSAKIDALSSSAVKSNYSG